MPAPMRIMERLSRRVLRELATVCRWRLEGDVNSSCREGARRGGISAFSGPLFSRILALNRVVTQHDVGAVVTGDR